MIRSTDYNPWTVIERYPTANAIGDNEIYMMYAGGNDFCLIGARLRICIAAYDNQENNLEDFWNEKYNEPF